MRKIRVFSEVKNLQNGLEIKLTDGDFDYLTKVMRQKVGDAIFIFNGADGEFSSEIIEVTKKYLLLKVGEKIAELHVSKKVTLAFALVKNVRIDYIAAKATELGATSFQPILTQHTVVDKINYERFKANVKEACEQCERNDFPKILPLQKLDKILDDEKVFILCDESGVGLKAVEVFKKIPQNKEIVVLVGPEGGFSKEEFLKMHKMKNIYSMSLGPRILRADTAIVAALALVVEFL